MSREGHSFALNYSRHGVRSTPTRLARAQCRRSSSGAGPFVADSTRGLDSPIKHDGYRTQLIIERGEARAYTRNGFDLSERYPVAIRC